MTLVFGISLFAGGGRRSQTFPTMRLKSLTSLSLGVWIACGLIAAFSAVDVKQPRHVHIAYGDYYVGSMEGWSTTFYFRSMPAGEDWGPSIVTYGDMGSANAQSLPRLLVDAAQGMYDAVVHV
ncbi:purple acid phosphatase, partial [Elysia marginata]